MRRFSSTVARLRGKERTPINLEVGQKINGFTVQRIQYFPDFECKGYAFLHEKSGAHYYHVDATDTENTFAVTFRTVPSDDTGVPHILEHTVLCGSEKFPVRDPFFNMLKRSLQTFMNAFTSLDWTAYPFATQNEKDFNNLLSVYLDATFFPNLRHHDFLQEGHRFEFEEKENAASSLKYSGVVYNEMKGAMSDPQRVFIHELTSNLFPDSPYRFNSGGDPKAIPSLTYDQFREFHKQYYHPSNSNIFTYGDLPPHLESLDHVLSRFDKQDPVSPVPLQPLWTQSRRVFATCPEDAMIPDPERQTKLLRAWITPPLDELSDVFGLHILSALLLDDPSAPFYRSLIEPNIGQSFAPGSGFSSDEKQTIFGVGLSGIKESDIERVEKIIQDTLEECLVTGFDQERIEAIIHQIELSQRHVSTGFGLNLFLRMVPLLNHGLDAFTPLELNARLEELNENIAKGGYFEGLIRKYLLKNEHSLTLVMNPDPEYTKKKQEEEENRLKVLEKEISESERQNIIQLNETLEMHQAEPQDTEVLPTLLVSDISKQGTYYGTEELTVGGIKVFKSVQPTNGMVYLRSIVNAHVLPEELRPYVPLFANCLSSMGAADLDYRQLAHQLKLHTGDVSVSPSTVQLEPCLKSCESSGTSQQFGCSPGKLFGSEFKEASTKASALSLSLTR